MISRASVTPLLLSIALLSLFHKPSIVRCSSNYEHQVTGYGSTSSDLETDSDIHNVDSSKRSSLNNLIQIHRPPVVTDSNNGDFELNEGYNFDTSQDATIPGQMGGIKIKEEAKKLSYKLRSFSNEEIGVSSMQAIYDSLHFSEYRPGYQDKLDQITNQLSAKLQKYLHVLRTNKITVETLYGVHLHQPITHQYDCCNVPKDHLKWSSQYSLSISTETSCDLVPPGAPPSSFNPGRNLTEVFQQSLPYVPGIKWQYFISSQGFYNLFPAHTYPNLLFSDCKNIQDTNHREVYLSTILPKRKNVLIVVDHGNSLSPRQLMLAKVVAKHVINSLGEQDRVGVIALSSEVLYPREDGCISHTLAPLSYEAKLYYESFIDKLEKTAVPTNHSLGFVKAFNMIKNTFTKENSVLEREQALIVYVSRGLLTSLTDAKDVLQTIARENGHLYHQVTINTYVVIDEGKPIMYEKTFMRDIAEQNFSKYAVETFSKKPVPVGKMISVTSEQNLNTVVGTFYDTIHHTFSTKPKVFLPMKDDIAPGVVLPIAWPCYFDNLLLGVMGLDIHFSDIVEDLTYFSNDKTSYAFVIDRKGSTVMHPSLERPVLSRTQPMHTNIKHFEKEDEFTNILQKILRQVEGNITINVTRETDNTTFPNSLFMMLPHTIKITYIWKHVFVKQLDDVPFIVVIKARDEGFRLNELDGYIHDSEGKKLVYHRLDLLPADNTCLHLKQLATTDTSALFLAASAFKSPFEHLNQDESKRMVQGYLVYLNDNTNLIGNPGLKDGVRKDVAAISKINSEWLGQMKHSRLNNYIVRRYVATPNGVMSMYPGTLLNKLYDPSRRDWYRRSVESPGKVTLTAPYLDTGGAGYIVTISHTIYEGKHAALHGPFDRIVAVMGMDVPLKFFYRVIEDLLPVCQHETIRCFIMDDRGYLITHKSLVETNSVMGRTQADDIKGKEPPEQTHISHQEPLVANDILNHKGFVRKKLCNSFVDRTMQRYYHFNTSIDRIVTNLVHGEHCAKYQLTPIPGTNAFFGIVNHTCDMVRAFCPCSVVDRLCLNCHRMEQTECECPCECPLDVNFCSGELLAHEDRFPSCSQYPENIERATISDDVTSKLPQCFPKNCANYRTKWECSGVVDCEWCELDLDRVTPLKQPFCSSQRVCYSGVLAAPTPYNDEVNYQAAKMQDEMNFKSAPVGPVAGGIMGCFLLLALGVYCYRHHVHRHSHHYVTSLPDNRNCPLDNDIEDLDPPDDMANGHTNIMLASFENPASISPYRVSSNYRRPTNAESDLGYSTMTPQDDSEQASTTCIEPLIIGRERYRPPSQTALKMNPILPPPPSGRRSCSPTPFLKTPPGEQTSLLGQRTLLPGQTSLAPPQTVIPEVDTRPNQVVANVQVHMVDSY